MLGEVRLGLASVQTVGRFLPPPPYRHPFQQSRQRHPLRLLPVQDRLDHALRRSVRRGSRET